MRIREHRAKPAYRATFSSVNQIYQMACCVRDMLAALPDESLATAKRKMGELEDVLWQAVTEHRERGNHHEGKQHF